MWRFHWICIVFLFLLIHNAQSRQLQRQRNSQDLKLSNLRSNHRDNAKYQLILKEAEELQENLLQLEQTAEIEEDALQCPQGCVCQYAHLMDLPISRWINYMQRRHAPTKATTADNDDIDDETNEDLINDNETAFEGDESFLTNSFIKQATCILQENNNAEELVNSLPHDLQALILLYTGIGKNKTVYSSVLKPLNQLNTLEIRGAKDRTFKLVIDEPLSFLQHANFESITLLGSEKSKPPKTKAHPSESFDYKPRIELDFYSTEKEEISAERNEKMLNKLGFETLEEIEEIVPYDVYLEEVKKARMPTFFGWEHLEVLRIQSCQLNELHWEMFDGLDSLQHLSLERNAIEVVTALALFGANNIRTLSLAHNAIHDLHYRALGGLLKLEMLDLSDNKLMKISEMSFPPFPKLESVDFRNNPIRYIFPATFGVMNNTRSMLFGSKEVALELWNNEPFQWLSKLTHLTLNNVSIGNLEHNIFQGLIALEVLKIKGTINSIEFDAFADQTHLRDIDLSNCQIQEISMDAFMGCKKLEVVNLARNNLSYIPPGLFDDQKNLEEIYLEGNQLRTLPINFFYQTKLKLVRLIDNPWKCSCDMYNWRPKYTNQVRGQRIERCITDYQSRKQLSCHKVNNYEIDHRFAPRCENYNGRSVFYVVRKNLQCGEGRVLNTYKKHDPVAGRRQRLTKLRQVAERQENYKEKLQQKKLLYGQSLGENDYRPENTRLTWQIRREDKIRRTLARENSIEHILQQQIQQQKQKDNVNTNVEEISNEI